MYWRFGRGSGSGRADGDRGRRGLRGRLMYGCKRAAASRLNDGSGCCCVDKKDNMIGCR